MYVLVNKLVVSIFVPVEVFECLMLYMNRMMQYDNEAGLIAALKKGEHSAYSYLFSKYYKDLVLYGGTIIPNQEVCEDIVQDIFLYMWDNRERLKIESLKSYLIKSVKNSCLDELKHGKIVNEHIEFIIKQNLLENNDTEEYILFSELNASLQQAIEKLPEDEKITFKMSKEKGMKYQQIAGELGVSVRTVEVRIAKSIVRLKTLLKDFFCYVIIYFRKMVVGRFKLIVIITQ